MGWGEAIGTYGAFGLIFAALSYNIAMKGVLRLAEKIPGAKEEVLETGLAFRFVWTIFSIAAWPLLCLCVLKWNSED